MKGSSQTQTKTNKQKTKNFKIFLQKMFPKKKKDKKEFNDIKKRKLS